MIEGTLAEIKIEGFRRLDPNFLKRQILASAGTPLNVRRLESTLQTLQQELLPEASQ